MIIHGSRRSLLTLSFPHGRNARVTFALLVIALAGCAHHERVEQGPIATPILFHLPGISGERNVDRFMLAGLRDGGYSGEIILIEWTGNYPGLSALFARKRNVEQAGLLARKIEAVFRVDPRRKIYISGHSGGNGVGVWALEKLPVDVQIERFLMLAPALSPGYDLSDALRHVRDKAYAFTSENDAIILGAGTTVLGTIDGVNTEAAGKVGFIQPADADPGQYRKLIAMPYDPAWMNYDNIGDHIGVLSQAFSEQYLAPLVSE